MNFGTATAQTVCFGLAMTAIGAWFGNQYTGRLASQSDPLALTLSSTTPEWIATVQTANRILLASFVVLMAALLALDHYGD